LDNDLLVAGFWRGDFELEFFFGVLSIEPGFDEGGEFLG
jgi:hypothetical protein